MPKLASIKLCLPVGPQPWQHEQEGTHDFRFGMWRREWGKIGLPNYQGFSSEILQLEMHQKSHKFSLKRNCYF